MALDARFPAGKTAVIKYRKELSVSPTQRPLLKKGDLFEKSPSSPSLSTRGE
jgi:hypothetical protein